MTTPRKPVRCAIYTRKSTEEGLDQEFNSLDAQRASAEAFIQSQASAGWVSAGRSGLPATSNATTLQQVVSTARAATASGRIFASCTAWRTATPSARHQASGSCSAQLGCGKCVA